MGAMNNLRRSEALNAEFMPQKALQQCQALWNSNGARTDREYGVVAGYAAAVSQEYRSWVEETAAQLHEQYVGAEESDFDTDASSSSDPDMPGLDHDSSAAQSEDGWSE